MTSEEKKIYLKEYRSRPGMKEKLNEYHRIYYKLNQQRLQLQRSALYHKHKLMKQNERDNQLHDNQ